jgi:single-strand DNA-binding protein
MYSNIVAVGRCVADPTLKYTPAGHANCTFTLAVDRPRKDSQGNKITDFFIVETWRGLAENCANFLSKGKLALASGEAHIDRWEKDGVKHQAFKISADTVRFLSPKEQSNDNPRENYPSHAPFSAIGHEISPDDDIPF